MFGKKKDNANKKEQHMKNKKAFVRNAEKVLNFKKWKPIILRHGVREVKQILITAKCFV